MWVNVNFDYSWLHRNIQFKIYLFLDVFLGLLIECSFGRVGTSRVEDRTGRLPN